MQKCSPEYKQTESSNTQIGCITKGSFSWDDKVEPTFGITVTHQVYRPTRKPHHPSNRRRKA